jgi:hypothetical protein
MGVLLDLKILEIVLVILYGESIWMDYLRLINL